MSTPVRFGTDGIRGKAGEHPCTAEVGVRVGRAAARLAGRGSSTRVALAVDTRPSATMLEAAVAAGIMAEGAQCVRLGMLPTSGVATVIAEGLAHTGVMLTASHNPSEDNGFKVIGPGGLKLSDAESAAVEAWIADQSVGVASPGRIFDLREVGFGVYTRSLLAAVPALGRLTGRRIAFDLAHGAGVVLRDWLRTNLPAECVFVGDGGGVINDGFGSEHPEALAAAVVQHGCDAGLAIDGDGDRCRLIDASGTLVDGDSLAWLLACGGGVERMAVTVMSTTALEASLPGVVVERTPVGDRHLAAAIREGAQLGCEESGHVLFHDALPTGDGLVTGLRALSYAFPAGSLAEAIAEFRPFPRRSGKLRVSERLRLDTLPSLSAACAAGEATLGGGRVFLRYSGTEPVLRILVEGPDSASVESVYAAVERAAREALS
jgi:phosphoglucosamine mutase